MADWIALLDGIHSGDDEGEAFHGPATRQILAGVTAQTAAHRPIPNAHTIWEIVQHVLAWRELACERMAGGERKMTGEADWAPVADTSPAAWEALLARLADNQTRLLDVVAGLSDEQRERHGGTLRFLVHHELAHAGQISLLRKAAP